MGRQKQGEKPFNQHLYVRRKNPKRISNKEQGRKKALQKCRAFNIKRS